MFRLFFALLREDKIFILITLCGDSKIRHKTRGKISIGRKIWIYFFYSPSVFQAGSRPKLQYLCDVRANIDFQISNKGLKKECQIMIWTASISRECLFKDVIPWWSNAGTRPGKDTGRTNPGSGKFWTGPYDVAWNNPHCIAWNRPHCNPCQGPRSITGNGPQPNARNGPYYVAWNGPHCVDWNGPLCSTWNGPAPGGHVLKRAGSTGPGRTWVQRGCKAVSRPSQASQVAHNEQPGGADRHQGANQKVCRLFFYRWSTFVVQVIWLWIHIGTLKGIYSLWNVTPA